MGGKADPHSPVGLVMRGKRDVDWLCDLVLAEVAFQDGIIPETTRDGLIRVANQEYVARKHGPEIAGIFARTRR